MPGKIFISYRRNDEGRGIVHGIQQYLEREFGSGTVFIDIDMHAGAKFKNVLELRLAESKVLLALIGPRWLDVRDDEGNRRLDDPNDWVRLEIAQALKRDITVIPVRIEGADLPKKSTLPGDIQGLVDHQAVTVTTTGFRNEMKGLAYDIRRDSSRWPFKNAAVSWVLLGVGVVIAAAVVAAVYWSLAGYFPSNDEIPLIGGAQTEVEQRMPISIARQIQGNLCVLVDDGKFGTDTREAIRQAKLAANMRRVGNGASPLFRSINGQIDTNEEAQIFLSAYHCQLDRSGKDRAYATAFEKYRFADENAIKDLQSALAKCDPNVQQTGIFDKATRDAISAATSRRGSTVAKTDRLNDKSYEWVSAFCI
jgi:TIR domain